MLDLAIDNRLFVTSTMQEAIQELDLLFSTEPGEMIGDVNYGANWEQFLHTLTPMESELKRYINILLADTYYCIRMQHNIEVKYIPGEVTCSYLIFITLTDPSQPQNSPEFRQNKIYEIK